MIPSDRNGTSIMLDATHNDMVRFSSREKETYKMVLYYIKDYVDHALDVVSKKWVIEDGHRRS